MANAQEIVSKYWRILAILVLCLMAFAAYKDWTLCFWVGFMLITLTNPNLHKKPQSQTQPAGPIAKLLLLSIFSILVIPAMFCILGPLPLILPEILSGLGFIGSLFLGLILLRRTAKRQEILKDL